jgi:hypothetical protein
MQNDLFFILAAVALYLWALRSILYWVRIWQASSYQPTLSTLAGRARKKLWQYVLSPSSLLTLLGIGVILFLTVSDQPLLTSQLIVLAILCVKAGIALRDILRNRLLRPSLHFRSVTVIILSFLLLSLLFLFPLTERFLWLLFLDRSIFFVVAFVITLFTFPSELYDDYQIRLAIKRVRQQSARSIMLLGGQETAAAAHSFGQLLGEKYTPLVIDSTPCTAASVASVINSEMTDEIDLLVIAVSSMSEDTISRIAAITSPAYLVMTCTYDASNEELIPFLQGLLPAKGKILLDVSWTRVGLQRLKKLVYFKTSDGQQSGRNTVTATQIVQNKSYLQFQAVLPTQTISFKTSLLGTYHAKYLLPLVYLADQLGIPARNLQRRMLSLRPLPHELTYHKSRDGITLVDDTTPVTSEKMEAALSYVKLFPKKRFLILGLSEEGLSYQEVKALGTKIDGLFSAVLLLQPRWQKALRSGIKASGKTGRVLCLSEREVQRYLTKTLSKGDIVLFAGDGARVMAETVITTSLTSS